MHLLSKRPYHEEDFFFQIMCASRKVCTLIELKQTHKLLIEIYLSKCQIPYNWVDLLQDVYFTVLKSISEF